MINPENKEQQLSLPLKNVVIEVKPVIHSRAPEDSRFPLPYKIKPDIVVKRETPLTPAEAESLGFNDLAKAITASRVKAPKR